MIKASTTITIYNVVDVESVTQYYKLQASTLDTPSVPTTVTPNGWTTIEPTYSEGSTNTLYTVIKTLFSDGTFKYSDVSVSSSYEAAKAAYNKAIAANNAAEDASKVATNFLKFQDGIIVGDHSTEELGKNVLIDEDSVDIRNGEEVLASFGTMVTIGNRTPLADGETNGEYSMVIGRECKATGICSHAEGYLTTAKGDYSHVEGRESTAAQFYSHAEGYRTEANGIYSHAEGQQTMTGGGCTHAEGSMSKAIAPVSHAEGYATQTSGTWSHSEGFMTRAIGNGSHSEGYYTHATGQWQHVMGKYNLANDDSAFIIGNGTSEDDRKNVFEIDWEGRVKIAYQKDASGTELTTPALTIGKDSAHHLEFDNNEILAKSNASTPSHLYLNQEGGNVSFNNNCTRAIMIQDGAIFAKNTKIYSGGWLGVLDGLNEAGNITLGYGNYLQSIGVTRVYGNSIDLYSKGDVYVNTNIVIPNASSVIGTNSSGNTRNNIQPCNANNNCVIGYGSYSANEGSTNLYGNNVSIISNGEIEINASNVVPKSYSSSYLIGATDMPWYGIYSRSYAVYRGSGKQEYGNFYVATTGTTSAQGVGLISAGNNIDNGKAENARGRLRLYGINTGYTYLQDNRDSTTNITVNLPTTGGTIALTSSDIRLKDNVVDTNINALDVVNRIKVRQFDWKETGEHQKIGFIADELEDIDPHMKLAYTGGYDSDGQMNIKCVDDFYMMGYVIKAIQELNEKIDSIKEV